MKNTIKNSLVLSLLLSFSVSFSQDTNKINELNKLSREVFLTDNYKKADSLAHLALKYSQKLGFQRGSLIAYKNLGNVAAFTGNYPVALQNFLSSLKIAEAIGYKKGIGSAYGNMGNIYYEQGDYKNALDYQYKSLGIDTIINEHEGIAAAYANIGNIYTDMGNYNKAIDNQLLALKEYIKTNNQSGIGNAYGDLGNVYYKKGDYDKALQNSLLSLKISRQVDDKYSVGYDYQYIANTLIKQKKYGEAKKYLDSALTLSKELGIKDNLSTNYNSRAVLDSSTTDFRTAFEDYKKYIGYRDSLKNEENTKKLVSEQMNYDFDKKIAASKAEQDKRDAIAKSEKKRQRIVIILVSIVLILVIIFSVILLNRFKTTQRQKGIIEKQKKLVEEKNKEVLASITYAKRLQDAILPSIDSIKKEFADSFVLYKPKDIVAGDFFFMEKYSGYIIIAAADCTGHGVPGAMVSMVCANALRRAVIEFHNFSDPAKILDKTRELVIETFEKNGEICDGMDISICVISPIRKELIWAGAYNPLLYVQKDEYIKEINADKQPVGRQEGATPFTSHTIQYNEGDMFYLFTDGFADQFGGPKNKKYQYKRLREVLERFSKYDMAEQKRLLDVQLEYWQKQLDIPENQRESEIEQTDDITIIGIKL